MKLIVDVKINPQRLARAFCGMGDEEQAQFFIEVAAIAETWRGGFGPWWQWHKVGRHLRDCECATEEARTVVLAIAEGINDPSPKESA